MKDKWQTGIYLFFYILLLAFMADFNVMLLLDAKSFFLLLAGGLLLALPFYRKGMEKREFLYIFGSKIPSAGMIQVFLLCFVRLSEDTGYEGLLKDIALCFRPMLYAFCIRLVLGREDTPPCPSEAASDTMPSDTMPSHESCQRAGLTKREEEIALLICQGHSNREIAETLVISETTVKKHIANIFEKTEIKKREELKAKLKDGIGTG